MSTKNCPFCGAPIALDAAECQYCGAKMPVTPPPQAPPPQYAPPQPQYAPPQYAPPPYGYAPPQYAPPPYGPPPYDPRMNTKSKTAAGLLGIFLGGIGVHKFYLGRVGAGIVYILFCWTGIPSLIGLIEGIIYLCATDEDFYYKYVRK
jgi:TM2 domain-containing membrane protein YozV